MTGLVRNFLSSFAHQLLVLFTLLSFLAAALLGLFSVIVGAGEGESAAALAETLAFWCFWVTNGFLVCYLILVKAFRRIIFAPEKPEDEDNRTWMVLTFTFFLMSAVSLFLLALLFGFFTGIDHQLIAQEIAADGWGPLDSKIFWTVVGGAMLLKMLFLLTAPLYGLILVQGRRPGPNTTRHLRSAFFFLFFGTSTVFFLWPVLYQFLLVRLAVPHDPTSACWGVIASFVIFFLYISLLLSFALRYRMMVRLRYRVPFVFMTLIIVCTAFGLAYYSRDHSLQLSDVPGFRQYVQPTRGNFRYFQDTDELGSPLTRLYFTDLLGRDLARDDSGEGAASYAYRLLEVGEGFQFPPGRADLPVDAGAERLLGLLKDRLLFLAKQERPFYLILVGGSDLPPRLRRSAQAHEHTLALERVRECKKALLAKLPGGFNADHILCLPTGSTNGLTGACATLAALCPPRRVVGSALLVAVPAARSGDPEASPALRAVVEPGARNYVSQYITLLDAFFYSGYTVTTTGYGLLPLDSVVKLYTTMENLFEVLIIAGLLGIVLSVRPSSFRFAKVTKRRENDNINDREGGEGP
jgi:hypothetical protein